jgi:D-beta-D-heptose 7-phosphate kinase/D-beta-D-heptose 1-phosphate adenosyltransferase
VKTRIVARHQQVVRLDSETRAPLRPETEDRLVRAIKAGVRSADVLVVSDYDKGVVSEELVTRVLAECRKQKVPAFVKPKWSRLPKYPGATAIVLNRAEASFLVTRSLDSEESIRQAGRALLDHFGAPAVIITRGEEGLSVFEQEESKAFRVAATGREDAFRPGARALDKSQRATTGGRQVFDVTGAGDTVLATLALGVAAGANVREAAVLANAAAGVVVEKLGTATLTAEELRAAVRQL